MTEFNKETEIQVKREIKKMRELEKRIKRGKRNNLILFPLLCFVLATSIVVCGLFSELKWKELIEAVNLFCAAMFILIMSFRLGRIQAWEVKRDDLWREAMEKIMPNDRELEFWKALPHIRQQLFLQLAFKKGSFDDLSQPFPREEENGPVN